MSTLSIADLMRDTEREFRTVFGETITTTSCETFGESSYRGGFRLVLAADQGRKFDILYSDLQLEVSYEGSEVFGNDVHAGFEGNMFSREHLRQYLPRIAASVAGAVQATHAKG
jgi:hypothetical protein